MSLWRKMMRRRLMIFRIQIQSKVISIMMIVKMRIINDRAVLYLPHFQYVAISGSGRTTLAVGGRLCRGRHLGRHVGIRYITLAYKVPSYVILVAVSGMSNILCLGCEPKHTTYTALCRVTNNCGNDGSITDNDNYSISETFCRMACLPAPPPLVRSLLPPTP